MLLPGNAAYIVEGEISLIITAMSRSNKFATYQQFNSHVEPLINALSQLRDMLRAKRDVHEVEPAVLLQPFLDVIRSDFTTGPVTSLALTSVTKFLNYGMLDMDVTGISGTTTDAVGKTSIASAMENVVNSATHARFVGTEPSSDEVVLMRILELLRAVLVSESGRLLSNESVCELLQACFRVCFETRLSELLRKVAEQCLTDMTRTIFSRIGELHEAPESQSGQASGASATTPSTGSSATSSSGHLTLSRRSRMPIGMTDAKTIRRVARPSPAQPASVTPPTPPTSVSPSDSTPSLRTEPQPTPTTSVAPTEDGCTGTEEQPLVSPDGESETARLDVPTTRDEFELIEKRDVVSDGDEPRADSIASASSAATLYELGPVDASAGSNRPQLNRNVSSPNQPAATPGRSAGPGWGLPALRELLRFITSIINPAERQNNDTMMTCGLQLLAVAVECAGARLRMHRSVLRIVQYQVVRYLVRLLVRPATRVSQYASALRCCFLLVESLRDALRWPLEYLLRKLLDVVAGGDAALTLAASPTTPTAPQPVQQAADRAGPARWSGEQRELALETLGALWRLPGLLTELFVNYDCAPHCNDVLESAVQLLARLACPTTGAVSNVHLLSLDALLTLVDVLEHSSCTRALAASTTPPSDHADVSAAADHAVRDSVPSSSELAARKRRKLMLQYGTEQFNSKPSKGIQFLVENGVLRSPVDSAELASFLRENSGVDKRVLGDFLSTKRNADILRAFVRSFSFENVSIDEALRTYLETFRLPGEAVPIQLVLEAFAEWWHEANGEPFASADAAFTLAYSVIMLNTDQHNPNSRRQNVPMKCEDFKRNLRGVNGGRNFDDVLLERIYDSIHNEEIVLPDEQAGALRETFEWKLIRRKMEAEEVRETEPETDVEPEPASVAGAYVRVASGTCDQEVFALSWGRIVSALCFVVDKCVDETIVARAVGGFRQCASIAAHLGMTDVVDKLVISLCKFSGLLAPTLAQPATGVAEHEAAAADAIAQQLAGSFKAQLVTRAVFQLVHRHGDFVRDGWRNVLDCLVQLYRAQLLPEVFVDVEDFLSPVGRLSLADVRRAALGRVAQAAQAAASSGVVSSLFAYFTSSSSVAASDSHATLAAGGADELEAARRAQDCVTECHLEQLTQDCKFLRTDSLHELLKALAVGATNGSCTHDTPVLATTLLDENEAALSGHVFFLELLVRVVLQNRDRIAPLWPVCRRYFALVLTDARQPTFLIERTAIGLVRIAIRLLRREDVAADVLHALNLLALMRPAVLCAVSPQLVAGLHDLVQTNPSNIRGAAAWRTVCTLLQTAGAGLLLPDARRRALLASFAELAPVTPAVASPTAVAPTAAGALADELDERRNWIVLPELSFQSHELRALVRSSETLSFVVQAPANLVSCDNFALLVHVIRVFIEVTSNSGVTAHLNAQSPNPTQPALNVDVRRNGSSLIGSVPVTRGALVNLRQATVERPEESPKAKAKVRKTTGATDDRKQSRKAKSDRRKLPPDAANAGATSPVLSPVTSDDDEPGSEDMYKNITVTELFRKLSLEMLELLYSLHTRALAVYTKNGTNADGGEELYTQPSSSDAQHLWLEYWCPALSAIARLCCDQMRTVRSHALTCLQRCLLMPELLALGPAGWSSCFRLILFPLLECLLSHSIAPHDANGLEETRARLTTLVCKMFLQHLQLLARRTRAFLDLWFTVLDYLDKYMRLEQNEWLSEAIPESLKNLLLVIDTTKVFETASLCSTASTHVQGHDDELLNDEHNSYTCSYATQLLALETASDVPLGSQLWELTWQRIDKFLPELKHEQPLDTMIHQQQRVIARHNSSNAENADNGGIAPSGTPNCPDSLPGANAASIHGTFGAESSVAAERCVSDAPAGHVCTQPESVAASQTLPVNAQPLATQRSVIQDV